MNDTASPGMEKAARAPRWGIWFVVALVLIAFFHTIKFYGLNAVMFPDEQVYSFDTRLRELSDVQIQNYLYYSVYRVVTLFGKHFLEAARLLNVLVFMLSAPFIYMISRMLCSRRLSAFIVLVSLVSPFSIYTQYFMPEVPYYTAFWTAAWAFMRFRRDSSFLYWAVVGASIALLSMIKYHGMFLLGGMSLYILWSTPKKLWREYIRTTLVFLGAMFLAFAMVKVGVGYILAGKNALAFFGGHYGSFSETGLKLLSVSFFLTEIFRSLFGEIQALCLLFGFPLLIAFDYVAGRIVTDERSAAIMKRLAALFLLNLIPLLAVTGLFSAIVTGAQSLIGLDYLESNRIHFRYYNFLFPAVLILVGYFYSVKPIRRDDGFAKNWLYLIPLAFALFVTITGFAERRVHAGSDCPELVIFWHVLRHLPLHFFALLSFLALFLWRVKYRFAGRFYLCVYIPLYTLYALLASNYLFQSRVAAYDNYLAIGITAQERLGPEVREMVIVDRGGNAGPRVLYVLDDSEVEFHSDFGIGTLALLEHVTQGKKWLLVFNVSDLPAKYDRFSYDFPPMQARLIRLADFDYSVDFSALRNGWPVADVRLDGDSATIRYLLQLPERLRLRLDYLDAPTTPPGVEYEVVLGYKEPMRVEIGTDYDVSVNDDERNYTVSVRIIETAPGQSGDSSRKPDLSRYRLTLREREEEP